MREVDLAMPTLQRIELSFRAVRLLVQPHKLEKKSFLEPQILISKCSQSFPEQTSARQDRIDGYRGTVERPVFLSEAGKNIV